MPDTGPQEQEMSRRGDSRRFETHSALETATEDNREPRKQLQAMFITAMEAAAKIHDLDAQLRNLLPRKGCVEADEALTALRSRCWETTNRLFDEALAALSEEDQSTLQAQMRLEASEWLYLKCVDINTARTN
jgi:hypothetical protein